MKSSKKIYYLVDSLDDFSFLKGIGDDIGYQIIVYLDGKFMLRTLELQEEKPEIIILDIHMPIFNGEEIVEIIRKKQSLKHIPIIMISSAYPKKLISEFNKLGVKHLFKRNNLKDFKGTIEKVLEESMKMDEVECN
ncbi:response regulator [Flavobacterium sp.]|jgi:CheY-like chemotaxis protein|uniref:response regulator n=1 Tax=Flavobacterium sp. TaxID=239 RepID=UPI0037C0470E